MYSKRREKTNPADAEIMKLRREGKEVPQELLDRKFNFNRERHSKDLRRQHDFLVANYDMQQAFLMDIAEVNRAQAENGLATMSASGMDQMMLES